MSKASGSFNNKMHIRVKVGDITIEVSVPSNKNADPAIIAEIARQAGEAAEKHCQAQSEKGFLNSVKRLFTFKGKNKSEGRKTGTPIDEEPVMLPPAGVIQTELVVIKNGKGLVHVDQPLKRKPPVVAKKPTLMKKEAPTSGPITSDILKFSRSALRATGKKPTLAKKEASSPGLITPDMLIGRRTTLRQTGIVW